MQTFSKNPIVFLWHYAMKNKKIFWLVAFFNFASILLDKLIPYLFAKLVALFEIERPFSEIEHSLYLNLGMIIGATIFVKLFYTLFHYSSEVILRPRMFAQIGEDTFRYVNGHSISYFADHMSGSLANQCIDLCWSASYCCSFLFYLRAFIGLIITFAMLAIVSIQFSILFTLCIVVSVFILSKTAKYSVKLREKMMKNRYQLSGNMIDTMQNNFFVKIFNGKAYEQKRAMHYCKLETASTKRSVEAEMWQAEGEKLYFNTICLSFLFYGIWMWHKEQISTADFVMIFLLLQSVSGTVSFLIHRGVIYSGVLAEIRTNLIPFATPHDIKDQPLAPKLKISAGTIEFKNVDFAYKGNPKLFKKFNLMISAGQKVGIVGMSGGGKSTLVNLLQRFYDIDKGEILIDGQNISLVSQQSLHQGIGYVPQTSALLERSVAANIAYGKPSATKDEIINAAKQSYAHDFIEELPNKYQTIINAQNQLSGGQMQRLSLARVLLKNAKILILDEATSALDSESEFYIQKAIDNMIHDKTVIAVAHRLSTLKHMDRIIVLENGKIVEDGTPQKLLLKKGKFYRYWQIQSLKKENNDEH